jgi:hypothetical protein
MKAYSNPCTMTPLETAHQSHQRQLWPQKNRKNRRIFMEGPFQVIPYNYATGWALPIAASRTGNPDCEPTD